MRKEQYLYDPTTGETLLTTRQAAEYMKYHYASLRKVISQGKIKLCKLAGKTLLFKKADLDIYLAKNSEMTEEHYKELDGLPEKLEAEITIDPGLGGAFTHPYKKIDNFTWEQIPLIKAELFAKYGKNMPFSIEIKSPDGSAWSISHEPPLLWEKLFKNRGRE